MTSAAAQLIEALTARGETVAVAESLTGGLVVARLVEVPGASAVVRGAVVAYATELKATLLGVDAELLARVGAVDPHVAVQMAEGVRQRLAATWGVGTTGVAGPDPQHGVDPGRAYVAVAGPGGSTFETLELGPVGRAVVREATVDAALDLLRRQTTSTTP
jgi:nicotinamide-nucleotide amidase